MPNSQQVICVTLSVALVVSSMGLDGCKKKEASRAAAERPNAPPIAMPTPDQLYQLVAPIALFPDNTMVAIVLCELDFPGPDHRVLAVDAAERRSQER